MKKFFIPLINFLMFCSQPSENHSEENRPIGVDTTPPQKIVKLVFIHHSVGRNWLETGNGNLGKQLNENNYYVNECYYGWDEHPDTAHYEVMGDHTDTEDWPYWFNDVVMPSVYKTESHPSYTNNIENPGGENEIVMFKSCYPNSDVGATIEDEKEIYNILLDYFKEHPDKMFILITPPPMISISHPEKTRELCNWLCDYENGWLAEYPCKNVFVFDLYNVLTDPNNHHWVKDGEIQHIVSDNPVDPEHPNELYYYEGNDNHPTPEGNRKATEEFIPLLNAYYHIWQEWLEVKQR